MDSSRDAFQQRLLATFKGEAAEHLRALSAGLMALEAPAAAGGGGRSEVVETVFRETHSLKGAARAVGLQDMEALCQAAEAVFSRLKRGEAEPSPGLLDELHAALEALERLLQSADGKTSAAERARATELCRRLLEAANGVLPEPAARGGRGPAEAPVDSAPAEAPAPAAEPPATVRIAAGRLDTVLLEAEALVSAKLDAAQRAADIRDIRASFAALRRDRARLLPEARALRRRPERAARGPAADAGRVDKLLDYLAWEDGVLNSLEGRLASLGKRAEHGGRALASGVDTLLEDMKRVLMLPFASVVEVLPRFVRDASRGQGKEVDCRLAGTETEIDRRILEEIRDPLLHLVRNSIDHGIEPPAARQAAGKPRRGSIDVAASQIEGGRIEVRVADDGAGLDRQKIAAAARRAGLAVPAGDDGSDGGDAGGLLALVFESGLSTSPIVTDLSGRGLGLAIVREKAERLGGSVTVESRPGAGAVFRLVLPLTLATFRGVRVRADGREFVFPTTYLQQVARVRRDNVRGVENRDTIRLDGETLALVRLGDVLGLPTVPAAAPPAAVTVVVAGSGERRIAFQVDEVINEQEVLLKGLGRQLARVRNVAGATILGNGRVVPVLYVPDLLKSARRAGQARAAPAAAAPAERRRSVLVAEDSITSRMLLAGILEAAGYRVATAADGMDALTRLRTEPFDLLVSDVDMPRLNGFDLTARIRADRHLAELPVVLVTALESREDRERGVDAGADAYLVKSGFDQDNLLAVVGRLI